MVNIFYPPQLMILVPLLFTNFSPKFQSFKNQSYLQTSRRLPFANLTTYCWRSISQFFRTALPRGRAGRNLFRTAFPLRNFGNWFEFQRSIDRTTPFVQGGRRRDFPPQNWFPGSQFRLGWDEGRLGGTEIISQQITFWSMMHWGRATRASPIFWRGGNLRLEKWFGGHDGSWKASHTQWGPFSANPEADGGQGILEDTLNIFGVVSHYFFNVVP